MRMLDALVHTAFARALSDALLHFLWEGAAAALVLAVCLCLFRSSRSRYAAACLTLLAFPLAFGLTLWRTFPAPHPTTAPAPLVRSGRVHLLSNSGAAPPRPAEPWMNRLPWLTPVWMFGVVCLYGRSLGSWVLAQRLRRVGVCAAPAQWQSRLRQIQHRLRVPRAVLLLESSLTEVPVVIGFFRPVVLAPLGFLSGFPADQVEAFLIHELAHIRRADYLVNLAQNLVEGLLFYHPAVWWISGVVRTEREHCCDDAVVAATGNAQGYAAALAALEQSRALSSEAALAVTGGSLMKRIQRLLGAGQPRGNAAPVVGLLLVSAALGLAAWTPAPQSRPAAPPPQVASPHTLRLLAQADTKPPAAPVPLLPDAPPADMLRDLKALQEQVNQRVRQLDLQINLIDLERLARQAQGAAETAPLPVEKLDQFATAAKRAEQAAQQLEMLQREVEELNQSKLLQGQQQTEAGLRQMQQLASALEGARRSFDKSLQEDKAYIITPQEREAFQKLQTDQERKQFVERLRPWHNLAPQTEAVLRELQELSAALQLARQRPLTAYDQWLEEDVAYIITDQERAAFQKLQTDKERDQFIEQFWLRRDPTPGTAQNEFKEEHYRRIAYANNHFGFAGTPGWKADRGRIYIRFGPPDERDEHPSGGAYRRPPAEGGGEITTYPFEDWRYRYIEGIGNDVIMEFVDGAKTGEYRMTRDPNEKNQEVPLQRQRAVPPVPK